MSKKKVSYMGLLKEAISEFDTSGNVDVKGPMLDPIIGYDGGGELQTHKNVSDILERYYFKQDNDPGVSTVGEEVDHIEKDAVDDKGKAMPKEAPKSDAAVASLKTKITGAMKDLTGSEEVNEQEEEEIAADADAEADEEAAEEEPLDVDKKVKEENYDLSETEELENQVIEKLIAEMEEEIEEGEEGEEIDLEEQDFTKDDSDTKAAPGDMDDRALVPSFSKVPDRKDKAEAVGPDAAKINDDLDAIFGDDDEAISEEEDIDEDIQEMLGPDLRSSAHDPEDMGDKESVEEQFAIFKEAIDDDEDDSPVDLDSDDIRV